jgi:hypothetical protein
MKKCDEYLVEQIKKNFRKGYQRDKALAVSYAETKKKHPTCKRVLKKKTAK